MGGLSSMWHTLAQIPGSPEAIGTALKGGISGDLSWNPYGNEAGVGDVIGGGTKLSQNPNARTVGRAVGSYFAGGALGDAFAGGGSAAPEAGGATLLGDAGGYGGSTLAPESNPWGTNTNLGASSSTTYDPSNPWGTNTNLKSDSAGWFSRLGGKNSLAGWGSLLQGGLGLYESYQMSQLGKGSASSKTAEAQLAQLLADPSSITSMPGYQAGLEAVQRTGAGKGYLGSGNMMTALSKYGGDFYNQTVKQLQGIASSGQDASLQYNIAGTQLFGQGVNYMAYGLAKLFGG